MAFMDESISGASADRDIFASLAEARLAFKFCPACASQRLRNDNGRLWVCPDCGFEYFHNVATAAGIIIECDGSIVLLKRAKEPRRGRLGLPGGFIEPGESAEDGAIRECGEELGWTPRIIDFLASYPNVYRYHGIPYATCDLYFCAKATSLDIEKFKADPIEVSAIGLFPITALPWEQLAFGSLRRALAAFALAKGIEAPLDLMVKMSVE